MTSELLTAAEKADLLALTQQSLFGVTTVRVLAKTAGADDAEGRATWTFPALNTVTAVGGRIVLKHSRELRHDVWVQVSTWQAKVGPGTTVSKGDRLHDDLTGKLFEVQTVDPVVTQLGLVGLQVGLLLVEGSVL